MIKDRELCKFKEIQEFDVDGHGEVDQNNWNIDYDLLSSNPRSFQQEPMQWKKDDNVQNAMICDSQPVRKGSTNVSKIADLSLNLNKNTRRLLRGELFCFMK